MSSLFDVLNKDNGYIHDIKAGISKKNVLPNVIPEKHTKKVKYRGSYINVRVRLIPFSGLH